MGALAIAKSFIYHDALVQLTCAKTQKYVNDKYEGKFIKPVMGCNDNTPYAGRLIGNSPELNPLDCSLFADLTSAITRHICLTSHMDEKDARKFTLTITGKITSVVDRLWNPHSPCAIAPERIATDINKVLRSMHKIIEYNNTIVPHLGNRNGIRAEKSGQGSGGPGRQYIRSLHMPSSLDCFKHPDVGNSTTDVLQATTMKFEGVLLLESSAEAPIRAFVNNSSTNRSSVFLC